jgi:hypothetical protein
MVVVLRGDLLPSTGEQRVVKEHFYYERAAYFVRAVVSNSGWKPEDEKPASPPLLKWRGLRRVYTVIIGATTSDVLEFAVFSEVELLCSEG